jgi:hypothetical protein
LKAVEAATTNGIGEMRFGEVQDVRIDLQHATLFLLMAYLATVDGLGKHDKGVKAKLKGISQESGINSRYGFVGGAVEYVSTDVDWKS